MSTWNLATEDFAAVWFTPGVDRFLPPLAYTSRFSHRNEQEQHHRSIRSRFAADDDFRQAVQDLREPATRLDIRGRQSGTREPFCVAAGAVDDRGVIVVQHERQRVAIHAVDRPDLAETIALTLPPLPGGRQRATTFHGTDIVPRAPRHDIYDAGTFTPRERYLRLVGDATGRGRIKCITTADQKDATAEWFDVPDDGRYLQSGSRRVTVAPADHAELVRVLGLLIAGNAHR